MTSITILNLSIYIKPSPETFNFREISLKKPCKSRSLEKWKHMYMSFMGRDLADLYSLPPDPYFVPFYVSKTFLRGLRPYATSLQIAWEWN